MLSSYFAAGCELRISEVYGSMDHVNIEVKEGLVPLPIDINNIRKRNLIQQTPFTFREPIKPKGTVSEIKINMQMIDGFMKKNKKLYIYILETMAQE